MMDHKTLFSPSRNVDALLTLQCLINARMELSPEAQYVIEEEPADYDAKNVVGVGHCNMLVTMSLKTELIYYCNILS